MAMFLKAGEKSYPNVSLANMKADTSGTFNKSQLYFHCFDDDCHNPLPAAESSDMPFTPPGPADRNARTEITEALSGLC